MKSNITVWASSLLIMVNATWILDVAADETNNPYPFESNSTNTKPDVPLPAVQKSVKKKQSGKAKMHELPLRARANDIKVKTYEIARSKLNRFVFPFEKANIYTTENSDDLDTSLDGSVLYVSTEATKPLDLFVADAYSNEAFNLRLLPTDLDAPVEINIEGKAVNGELGGQVLGRSHTGANTEYVSNIKEIMKSLARFEIPDGFAMTEVENKEFETHLCESPGVKFKFGQLLQESTYKVLVLVAENVSGSEIADIETRCANENVISVAAWPLNKLAKGQKTEVFILMKNVIEFRERNRRPSLL